MANLARWCFNHRRIVVALWVVGVIALFGISASLGPEYKDDFKLPNTESKKAVDLLQREFPQQSGDSITVVVHADAGIDDAAVQMQITNMFDKLASLPQVEKVGGFYGEEGSQQISEDRKTAFANLQLKTEPDDTQLADVEKYIAAAQEPAKNWTGPGKLQVELSGQSIQNATQDGPGSTEFLGVIAAAVVLFIAFGSLFSTFMPILCALLAVSGGFAIIGFLTHFMSVAEFGPTLAALIGLGVGIDYALFIVSRHRNNLHTGHTPEESVVTAVNTSGRAVLFAGTTVCIALLGLFLVGVSFLYGAALSAVAVVLVSMLSAVTFLPAMLGFIGMKALSRKERRTLEADGPATSEDLSPAWYRWARVVERKPILITAVSLVAILAIASPFLSLRLGSTDAGNDPSDSTTRKAYDLLAQGFGPGFNGPLQLAAKINSPSDLNALTNLADAVSATPGVARVSTAVANTNNTAAVVQVYPKTSPQDEETSNLIKKLRTDVIPRAQANTTLETYIGGPTAIFDDFSEVLASKLPVFIGSVVAISFILLVFLFRSILIPFTASIMNLLSVGAAFGAIVAVFQWGWLGDFFGIDKTGPIDAFLPVMLFAILFGLSMDYQVFLVSRMHEEWERTQDNNEAIALGQAETGRVITAAAAIMILVFGSFILDGSRIIKLFGLGLSCAILIDALIIRSVLVPATMHLLGKANWWLPSWLEKRIPKTSL